MMPEPVTQSFKLILEYVTSRPLLEGKDLDFMDAFCKELLRLNDKARQRKVTPPSARGEHGSTDT